MFGDWGFVNSDEEKLINKNTLDEDEEIEIIFKNKEVKKEKILCVGKVQSGKTRKIFKTIKYAFDKEGYDIIILLGGITNTLYNQTSKRLHESFDNEKNIKILDKNVFYDERFKVIYNILKNKKVIENLLENINCTNLTNKKILIIDDECDYASVNNSNDEENSSKIYDSISELFKRIHCGKILFVTATPFANILSNKSKILEPERLILWSNSNEYTGLIEFDSIKKDVYKIIQSNKIDSTSWADSIKESLFFFIIQSIQKYHHDNEIKLEFLINISLIMKDHQTIFNIVSTMLKNIKNNLKSFYGENYLGELNFEEFKNAFIFFIENLNLEILNSDNKINNNKNFNIFIGGNFISRGNTFENLICELIINSPQETIQVDTLLQRCRWFGYRKNVIYDMRIFMNEKIYNALDATKEYIDVFSPGENNLCEIRKKISHLDINQNIVKGTSNGKY